MEPEVGYVGARRWRCLDLQTATAAVESSPEGNANPDVGQAASSGLINAFDHLMQFGVNEGRNLGNGVLLSNFSNDPGFTTALSNGNAAAALLRMESVAPFIPTFQRPVGWTPPRQHSYPC